MKNCHKSYNNLNDKQKQDIITELYCNQKLSFADIASMYGTYANKIRRDAVSLNIEIRSKSDAQKNALQSGKHKHPTKGSKRSQEIKDKIGSSVLKSWESLSDTELNKRKEKARQQWIETSEEDKNHIIELANQAVRKASKIGSKLENYLLQKLLDAGYKADFHKEQNLLNTRLQIDIFLPKINTAIEIDGPSHFEPVWGSDALKRNIKYDNKKQGLILGKGMVLIRIKQLKDFSKARADRIFAALDELLRTISKKFPEPDNRIFTIED